MSRARMIAFGLLVTAYKGVKLLWLLRPARLHNRISGSWGFSDRRLVTTWREQVTLPRGSRVHHRTDLIVEWVRLNPQRGAKLLLGLGALAFFVGLLGGLLIA